jgi:hypothetical protein
MTICHLNMTILLSSFSAVLEIELWALHLVGRLFESYHIALFAFVIFLLGPHHFASGQS